MRTEDLPSDKIRDINLDVLIRHAWQEHLSKSICK